MTRAANTASTPPADGSRRPRNLPCRRTQADPARDRPHRIRRAARHRLAHPPARRHHLDGLHPPDAGRASCGHRRRAGRTDDPRSLRHVGRGDSRRGALLLRSRSPRAAQEALCRRPGHGARKALPLGQIRRGLHPLHAADGRRQHGEDPAGPAQRQPRATLARRRRPVTGAAQRKAGCRSTAPGFVLYRPQRGPFFCF